MMTNSPLKRLALLIDADNAQLSYVEHVLRFSQKQGQVEICRAYGDWKQSQLAPWLPKLQAQKIECIQVNRNGKNATDHRLLMDAGEILGSSPGFDLFVIVSGDGDFTSACARIKEKGKQVIGIGNRNQTSNILQKSCDKFYILEDLEHVLSRLEEPRPIPPSEVGVFSYHLFLAYHKLTETDDWISYSQLGMKLRELVPDFESKFGQHKLSELLRGFDKDFEICEQKIRRIGSHPELTRLTLLLNAFYQARQPDGLAHLGQLGNVLREMDPHYESRFSGKKLSKWLEAYPRIFKTNDDYVCLV